MMKRGMVREANKPRWFTILERAAGEMEVSLNLGQFPDTSMARSIGVFPDVLVKEVCRRGFVDFRQYQEDDGKPIENSLEERIELYSTSHVRDEINATVLLERMKMEAPEAAGEDVAASG